jgi:hypothetical protein
MLCVQGSPSEWGSVFQIMAGALTIGGIVFIIFGSADVQPWAMPQQPTTRKVGMIKTETTASTTVIIENHNHDNEFDSGIDNDKKESASTRPSSRASSVDRRDPTSRRASLILTPTDLQM